MKISFAPLTALLLLALVPACSASSPALPQTAPQETSVQAKLDITGPGGYHVLTLTAWNKADVDHVTLSLLKNTGSGYAATGATKTVSNANLATALTFSNLRYGTSYKVVANAFNDAAGTVQIDNIAQAGNDTACSVAFTTPSLVTSTSGDNVNDTAMTITIPVRLKDKTFAGQASAGSGVGVTNGTIVNTTATETF